MANSINRVIVSGNATRPPELNRTQGGMAILNIGIAVNDRRKNQQTGEWDDYANFFDVRVFGNRAESLAGIVTKGMYLTIEGKLRWSQWEARDGSGKRSKVEIIADEVVLPPRQQSGGSGNQGGAQGGYQQQGGGYNPNGYSAMQNAPQQPQGYQQAPQQAPVSSVYDDIPF